MCSGIRVTLALIVFAFTSWAQVGPPKDFKFTQVDEKLLEEVEIVDRLFEKKGLVFNDPELETHLAELALPILESAGKPERVRWKFRVLRDPSVNAFAMPNGSIYFHTGLLALLENDAQLAGILAHEVTHVANRHTYQHHRSFRKKMVALHILSAVSAYAPTGTVWGAVINVVANVGSSALVASIFGYSQDLEREADVFAVERVAAGGFDPNELPKSFKLLDEKLEAEPVETFYRSHPKLEERYQYTSKLAMSKTGGTAKRTPEVGPYLAIMRKAVRYNVEADVDSRRFRTAVARAQRLADHEPSVENTVLLADAYRSLGARTATPSEKDLTSRGQSDARKRAFRQTMEEEEKELLKRPDGPKVREANRRKAEELYLKVQASDPNFAPAYRGLGMLKEEEGQTGGAIAAYAKYIELAHDAHDALRFRRRLEALQKGMK